MTGNPDFDMRIAAYLDGAISDTEAEAFEQEVADNPELAAELERLASNDALLREAFAEHEVDEDFMARMGLGASDTVHAPAADPMPVAANDNPPFWRRWSVPIGGAIAAGLALAVTYSLPQGAGGGIGNALESTPSGQLAMLDQDTSLTPILSFQAADGRFCREFAYSDGGGERVGIACRGGSGWGVEAWGEGAAQLPEPDQISLASGADSRTLEETYRSLDAGDPILAAREKALIARGWKSD